jgi:hypothetical protein
LTILNIENVILFYIGCQNIFTIAIDTFTSMLHLLTI